MVLPSHQDSFVIYPPPRQVVSHPSTPAQRDPARLRLTPRDDEILQFLYIAGYAQTNQISEACFENISSTSRLRATQRRLKQLADVDLIRVIEQPVYPRQRTGARSLIYTLASLGGSRVADRLGLNRREIDTRPKPRETNISWLGHTLALVDYYLALKRACSETEIALESWVTDRILQKEADRVEITNKHGTAVTVGVVPDACYVLGLPQRVATALLEYDRATVTLEPGVDAWTQKGWRRKVQGLLALADSGKLKQHYGADSLFVTVVTTSEARLQNMVKTTEKAAGERAHHFWFTSEDRLINNVLRDPIWTVAGKPGKRHALL